MKASELVVKLSELIERHGDKEVEVQVISTQVFDEEVQLAIKDIVNTDNPRMYGEVFLMTVL